MDFDGFWSILNDFGGCWWILLDFLIFFIDVDGLLEIWVDFD